MRQRVAVMAARSPYTLRDLRARGGSRLLSRWRNALYGALRDEGYTWPQIGRLMRRDHSTAVVCARKAADEDVDRLRGIGG